jgi:hypothetical protein
MRDLAILRGSWTGGRWLELGKNTPRRGALLFCGATGDVPKWQ